jgi:hypothetical protein
VRARGTQVLPVLIGSRAALAQLVQPMELQVLDLRMGLACVVAAYALVSVCGCTDRNSLELACGSEAESSCAALDSEAPAVSAGAPTPLPCEVRQELSVHCWSCHGETLQFTAPMKLVSVEDFLARAPSDSLQTVAQRAKSRIHDSLRPMPPPPLPALEQPGLLALDDWLDADPLRSGPQECQAAFGPRTGVAGASAATTTPVLPPAAQGGGSVPVQDGDLHCVPLRAHGASRTAPFTFKAARDLLQCFEFNAPWGDQEVYGVAFRPRIDNSSALHHMLLYQNTNRVTDGGSAPCLRADTNSSLLAAWAPGTGDMIMPDDVGMQLSATGYTLEIHYNGSGSDSSGIEVCYTSVPRTHTAAMHWLGTTRIFGTRASGVCRPTASVPIHTFKLWPHMHLSGAHMNLTINRANGSTETWHDAPFDFANQRLLDSDRVIMPGDTVTTTCTYSKPAIYGEGTAYEMCFDVVLAYPVGALTQPGGTWFATNQCVD